ncbi:glycosyltransferase family 4 protein [Sphingomonas colocasiae]|uniref:Glycosyltransferase family 4 protein n=1 Tax=Sphingomonas colocasiae TaxID=1848973 RepID=A0ABS7PPB6_9SPHN|nr:glycosyltransferase family 1 protein [Sphingomonas colocasiae]MBY8823051.1 glycosyltransferase family 4 protein [Sphingomonas colocasiae]
MAIRLPTFFSLLPSRFDEIVGTRFMRGVHVRRRRARKGKGIAELGGKPRLFVDLAVISKHDAGTGIQRVVRALALALSASAPEAGWDIRFVSATRRKGYRPISWPLQEHVEHVAEIEGRPGDVFLGLDYALDTIRWHRRQLARFRRNGGQLWFLVHDLLPLQRPDWFSRNTGLRYKAWLDVLAGLADGFLCNSHQTETDLRQALNERYGLTDGYRTNVIPMGSNILESLTVASAGKGADIAPRFDVAVPYFLMVGTLEPRKGHEDILLAFDALWRLGARENLVLVGRQGWQVAPLVEWIGSHREHGARLFWFDDVGDQELVEIYKGCAGVIIASHAEGFGLPLIEALNNDKPVLARDLAVFRPHEIHGVRYFPADAGTQDLAENIRCWVDDVLADRIAVTQPESDWRLSATKLLAALLPGV